jgi:hypothetical protein
MAVVGTAWAGGNALFTANHAGDGTSVAAGYLGSDGGASIDLGSTRVLWTFGDTFWASAAGKTRAQCQFLHNTVALQTVSYDLSASTLTFYAGTDGVSTTAFFDGQPDSSGAPHWFWPVAGSMVDDKLLVFMSKIAPSSNAFGFSSEGTQAVLVDNPTAAPDAWTMTYVPAPTDFKGTRYGFSVWDDTTTYLYAWGYDPDGAWRILRWSRTEAKAGRLLNPQRWCGATLGWSTDPLPSTTAQVTTAPTQNSGNTRKRSDAKWQQVTIAESPGQNLSYAEIATGPEGVFPAVTSFYALPEAGSATKTTYNGLGHPEQTWAGKATDDLLVSYASNSAGAGSVFTDMTVYFPKVVQVTGI